MYQCVVVAILLLSLKLTRFSKLKLWFLRWVSETETSSKGAILKGLMVLFQKTLGYCWRTQKCRNFCLTHAFLEGQEAWGGLLKKPQSRSIEVGSPTVSDGILLANSLGVYFNAIAQRLCIGMFLAPSTSNDLVRNGICSIFGFANSIPGFFKTDKTLLTCQLLLTSHGVSL